MQFFHPIFTHPGKVILVQPCISLSPRFSFSKPISQISQISTMQEGKFHTESRELRRRPHRRPGGRAGVSEQPGVGSSPRFQVQMLGHYGTAYDNSKLN